MACEYCRRITGHDTRCPNYEPPKTDHYCSICDEGIYPVEDYVVNNNGEYAHLECVDTGSEMADFLGYEVKCDEEFDEWDYYND